MSVRVVARIRPLLAKELDKDTIVHAGSADGGQSHTLIRIPSPKNEAEEFTFAFNSVYGHQTSQEALFSAEVSPPIKSLFQGLDVTIFAYGVTGTGKTHTMRGGTKLADRGVIPRLLSAVFRRAKKLAKDSDGKTQVAVALSYYEIYNDKVYDLLEPPEKRSPSGLPLREANGRTTVVGLSERACEDLKDFETMYVEGNNNRVTASTKLNAHSSRSHAILRVKVTQTTTGDSISVRESTASAIDLAGSEDNRRTDNGRERLVESAAINKSLFVLSQCIDAISRGDRRIPFRESKMTRILSLGQNKGITVMILNLAPLRSYHLDTLSSLNVSSRAKRIEVREIENEVVYKSIPKSASSAVSGGSGTGMATRQPLRPLPNSHNVHAGALAAAKDKPAATEKPVKAFNVYTDRAGTGTGANTSARTANTGIKRTSTQPQSHSNTQTNTHNKRPSDITEAPTLSSRPTKMTRPTMSGLPQPTTAIQRPSTKQITLTTAQIEAMVEKKVSEILASQTTTTVVPSSSTSAVPPPPPPPPPAHLQSDQLTTAVQARLDALERRIEARVAAAEESQGPERAEGLRFLLKARTCKERGEHAIALAAYESALPFFPGQEARLRGKMEKLRARIAGGGGESSPRRARGRGRGRGREGVRNRVGGVGTGTGTDELGGGVDGTEADNDDDDDEDAAVFRSPRKGGRKAKSAKTPKKNIIVAAAARLDEEEEVHNEDDERIRQLLRIVNSRDVAAVMSLSGFGAKKAKDLVDALREMQDEVVVGSVQELRMLPGLGGRGFDRAVEGLGMGLGVAVAL